MNVTMTSSATPYRILRRACRAPSVHNSRPRRWRVTHQEIFPLSDPAPQLLHIVSNGRDLLLGCGAALHHLRLDRTAHHGRRTTDGAPRTARRRRASARRVDADPVGTRYPSGAPLDDSDDRVHRPRRLLQDGILRGVTVPQIVVGVGWWPVSYDPVPATARRSLSEALER